MSKGTPEGQVEAEISIGQALEAQFDELESATEELAAGEDVREDDEREEEEPVAEQESADEEESEAEEASADDEVEEYNEPAPERWPAEMKEQYNKLPPAARKIMMEGVFKPMQRQYTKTTQELAEERKRLGPMLDALKEHRQAFEEAGASPEEVFRNTLAWGAHLTRVGPEQGLADLRASYGLTDAQGNEKPDQYLTRTERALKERLDKIDSTLNENLTAQQKREQQTQQQQLDQYRQQVREEIAEFVNEERDGKPAHPHVQELSGEIQGLIRGGLVPKVDDYGRPLAFKDQLRQAYNMAVNLNPRFSQAKADEGQVKRAKAASEIGVTAKSKASQDEVEGLPLNEDLMRQYDRLAGNRR